MKRILVVSVLIFVLTETTQAQRMDRGYNRYTTEAADQIVIKELQREILDGVQSGRLNRQLTAKEARSILKQYRNISSREIKLYQKRRLNERKLFEVRNELEDLVQQLYSTIRFERNNKSGWVRAKRY